MIYTASLACANQLDIKSDVDQLLECGIKYVHIDIMDNHFVPNICLNPALIQSLKKKYGKALIIDAHFMVTNPDSWIEKAASLGTDIFFFHLSATNFPFRLLSKISENNMKAGITLNPQNSIAEVLSLLPYIDFINIMAVEPGFSGQSFMPETFEKVALLAEERKKRQLSFLIAVDGGVNAENSKKLRSLGADMLVMGVFTFFLPGCHIKEAVNNYLEEMKQ